MKKLLLFVSIISLGFYGLAFAELQVVDGPITAQSVNVTGLIAIRGGSPGVGKVLTSDADGDATWQAPAGGGMGGSGTTNYFPIFTGTSSIGNSVVYQSGSNVGVGTTSPAYKLDVAGAGKYSASLYLTASMDQLKFEAPSALRYWFMSKPSVNYAFGWYSPDELGWLMYLKTGTGDLILPGSNKLGIGAANPLARLQLGGSNYETNLLSVGAFDTTYVKSGRLGSIYPYVIDTRLIADNSGWGFGWTHENVNDSAKYTMMYLGPDGQYGSNYRLWLDGAISLGDIAKSYADIGSGFPTMATTIKLDPAGNSFINSGNVGIGTTSPSEKLTSVAANNESFLGLSGDSGSHTSIALGRTAGEARLAIASASGLYSTSAATGDAILRVDGSSQKLHLQAGVGSAPLTVTSTNVGIGTGNTTPLAKLEVNGNLIASSGTVANGLVYCSGGVTHSGSNFVCNAPRVDYVNGNYYDFGNYVTCYSPNVRLVCMALGGRYYTSSCSSSTTPISGGITAVDPYTHVVWQDWANIAYTLSVTCSPLP